MDHARHLAQEPLAAELAIWLHDAIYDPRAGDNEERSAELAKAWLSQSHVGPPLAGAVGRLVLATKQHDASLHVDAALLVDVDLSILGQSQDRFWEYEAQIRIEFDKRGFGLTWLHLDKWRIPLPANRIVSF